MYNVVDRVSVKPLTEFVNKALAATNPVRYHLCVHKLFFFHMIVLLAQ